MFLKFFSLRKHYFTSSAMRYSFYFYNKWLNQKKLAKLSLYKKWKAGRNNNGKVIIWTKSKLNKKNKYIKINYSLRYNRLGIISTFQFIPYQNKLVSLIFFANGSASYYTTAENHKLFTYFYYNTHKKLRRFKLKSYKLLLCQIKKLSKISFIELYPGKGAQYCLSSGTFGKIIKFDKIQKNALIELPSGIKKTFSNYSFVLNSKIALNLNHKCTSTKAGYWRNFGLKPCVRGVAMNPVDHPHGGRTKAIRYQRTPWGKTTKYK